MAAMGVAPVVMPDTIHVTDTAQNSTNPHPVTRRPRSAAIRPAAHIVPIAAIHSSGPSMPARRAGADQVPACVNRAS